MTAKSTALKAGEIILGIFYGGILMLGAVFCVYGLWFGAYSCLWLNQWHLKTILPAMPAIMLLSIIGWVTAHWFEFRMTNNPVWDRRRDRCWGRFLQVLFWIVISTMAFSIGGTIILVLSVM